MEKSKENSESIGSRFFLQSHTDYQKIAVCCFIREHAKIQLHEDGKIISFCVEFMPCPKSSTRELREKPLAFPVEYLTWTTSWRLIFLREQNSPIIRPIFKNHKESLELIYAVSHDLKIREIAFTDMRRRHEIKTDIEEYSNWEMCISFCDPVIFIKYFDFIMVFLLILYLLQSQIF